MDNPNTMFDSNAFTCPTTTPTTTVANQQQLESECKNNQQLEYESKSQDAYQNDVDVPTEPLSSFSVPSFLSTDFAPTPGPGPAHLDVNDTECALFSHDSFQCPETPTFMFPVENSTAVNSGLEYENEGDSGYFGLRASFEHSDLDLISATTTLQQQMSLSSVLAASASASARTEENHAYNNNHVCSNNKDYCITTTTVHNNRNNTANDYERKLTQSFEQQLHLESPNRVFPLQSQQNTNTALLTPLLPILQFKPTFAFASPSTPTPTRATTPTATPTPTSIPIPTTATTMVQHHSQLKPSQTRLERNDEDDEAGYELRRNMQEQLEAIRAETQQMTSSIFQKTQESILLVLQRAEKKVEDITKQYQQQRMVQMNERVVSCLSTNHTTTNININTSTKSNSRNNKDNSKSSPPQLKPIKGLFLLTGAPSKLATTPTSPTPTSTPTTNLLGLSLSSTSNESEQEDEGDDEEALSSSDATDDQDQDHDQMAISSPVHLDSHSEKETQSLSPHRLCVHHTKLKTMSPATNTPTVTTRQSSRKTKSIQSADFNTDTPKRYRTKKSINKNTIKKRKKDVAPVDDTNSSEDNDNLTIHRKVGRPTKQHKRHKRAGSNNKTKGNNHN